VNFTNIPGVTIGLQWISSLGIGPIHDRVIALTDWTLRWMNTLRHSDGVCRGKKMKEGKEGGGRRRE
jgi:hypothetical protein